MFRKQIFAFILTLATLPVFAQPQVADRIIGVVGNKIILLSDLNTLFNQEKKERPDLPDSARCFMFYNLMAQQVLVEQAARDSVIVTDEEVEEILDNRIRQMMQQYGSKEAFEEANGGRTIYQLKDDFRSFFKDRTIADRMQAQVMQNVKITPQEIEAFYKDLAKDTLPLFPATVEMGQIVVKPDVDPEVEKMAREKTENIRKDIVENGKSFETMAGMYSMDGTKDNGGELTINRQNFDPQFVAAAYRLQPGEISPVVKSKFGYHVIQMVRRMGDEARVRHIVIIPDITNYDLQKSSKKLDSIRADLVSGKITFSTAVGKYSTDEQSKMTGGMVVDPSTGGSVLDIDKLDPAMARAVADMKVGEYSQPQIFTDPNTGSRATRILYMKNRTDPHELNLKDDYAKIQQVALQKKQNEYLDVWLKEKVPSYYIKIDPNYGDCFEVKGWVSTVEK